MAALQRITSAVNTVGINLVTQVTQSHDYPDYYLCVHTTKGDETSSSCCTSSRLNLYCWHRVSLCLGMCLDDGRGSETNYIVTVFVLCNIIRDGCRRRVCMSRNHGNRIHHVFAVNKALECVDYIRTVAELILRV